MADNKLIEKKKVDIYSLYKKEKTIHIEDDEGNYIDVLFIKMNQGQRIDVLDSYNAYIEKERVKLREREESFHQLALATKQYKINDIIDSLITFELAQYNEVMDLYPLLEGKTEEEKKKVIEEETTKFKNNRKEELSKKTEEEVAKLFIDMSLEAQALLNSIRILNYSSLVYMCHDAETRQPIFNSIDDINKILDKNVIEQLINEMTEFRKFETPKKIREVASNDSSFLGVGESPKSSTDFPVTTS